MRQFKKKLRLAMKASKHFFFNSVKSAHHEFKDDAFNYRFESKELTKRRIRHGKPSKTLMLKKLS